MYYARAYNRIRRHEAVDTVLYSISLWRHILPPSPLNLPPPPPTNKTPGVWDNLVFGHFDLGQISSWTLLVWTLSKERGVGGGEGVLESGTHYFNASCILIIF